MDKESGKTLLAKENLQIRDRIRELSKGTGENYNKISVQEALIIDSCPEPEKEFKKKTLFVRKNLQTVMDVAAALLEVREKCLYRLRYNTFPEYIQQEFDYSKSRAYQLIRAKELAVRINSELDDEVLVNESQCRELLRLKKFDKTDKQQVNVESTFKARLKLIKQLKSKDIISTNKIAIEVDKIILADEKKRSANITLDEYRDSFAKSCKGIKSMFDNILEKNKLKNDDQVELKKIAIKELENLISQLK